MKFFFKKLKQKNVNFLKGNSKYAKTKNFL